MLTTNANHSLLHTALAAACAAFAASLAGAETPLVSSKDLAGDGFLFQTVVFEGVLTGLFKDETNPDFHFATLKDACGTVYLSAHASDSPFTGTNDYTGCRVRVTGRNMLALEKSYGQRKYISHELQLRGRGNFILLDTPRKGTFDVPVLTPNLAVSPEHLAELGLRRLKGRVLAVRQPDEMLLLYGSDTVSRVSVLDSGLPRAGDYVEASGVVETDTYFLNLAQAKWRGTEPGPAAEQQTLDISAHQIATNALDRTLVNTTLHGRQVRMRAIVRSLPEPGYGRLWIFAESDGMTFPIDAGACPEVVGRLKCGDEIAATGVCWIEIENWRPAAIFPQAKGFSLVLRSPDDIVVLSHPPWWNPARLAVVIGALTGVLLAVFVWNIALRHAVKKRGTLLFREKFARASAELKTKERSRLAIELHDSISQTLAGAALKIKAAQTLAKTDLDKSLENLSFAENSLRSSREELRYCLWDLRNDVFDLPDLDKSVRLMLKPNTGDAKIRVRMKIQRGKIDGRTVREMLKIVRELAINATRHGGASKIHIAGCIQGGMLSFSVRDDGSGYDEKTAPGPEQGHFGLLGIRDRLAHYSGSLDIRALRGGGTKARVDMLAATDGTEKYT